MGCKIYNEKNKLIAKFYNLKTAMDFMYREKSDFDKTYTEEQWFGVWQKNEFIGEFHGKKYIAEFLIGEYKLKPINSPQ